ncbi:JDVT-CTERM system CAAX-type protease [Desulfonatronum sp. SC1]|nr:JDVT-CTERM system CAAX-type protease [Desulfonatronum sp. SC1]
MWRESLGLRLPVQTVARGAWLRDPWLYTALALAPTAWLLPAPGVSMALWRLGLLALAEEVVFRGLLQEWLRGRTVFLRSWGPLTLANLVASACFAAAHLLAQPPLWAAAVFFPSLIFGWIWDRHGRILPCVLVHFSYNLCFFHRF